MLWFLREDDGLCLPYIAYGTYEVRVEDGGLSGRQGLTARGLEWWRGEDPLEEETRIPFEIHDDLSPSSCQRFRTCFAVNCWMSKNFRLWY